LLEHAVKTKTAKEQINNLKIKISSPFVIRITPRACARTCERRRGRRP